MAGSPEAVLPAGEHVRVSAGAGRDGVVELCTLHIHLNSSLQCFVSL